MSSVLSASAAFYVLRKTVASTAFSCALELLRSGHCGRAAEDRSRKWRKCRLAFGKPKYKGGESAQIDKLKIKYTEAIKKYT